MYRQVRQDKARRDETDRQTDRQTDRKTLVQLKRKLAHGRRETNSDTERGQWTETDAEEVHTGQQRSYQMKSNPITRSYTLVYWKPHPIMASSNMEETLSLTQVIKY